MEDPIRQLVTDSNYLILNIITDNIPVEMTENISMNKITTYPYAIKNQRKARNAPSRRHFVPKPLVGGFGCLELVLYGIRELA